MNDDETPMAWYDPVVKRSKMDALREHVRGPAWNDRYSRIPSEKQIALDELFGVK